MPVVNRTTTSCSAIGGMTLIATPSVGTISMSACSWTGPKCRSMWRMMSSCERFLVICDYSLAPPTHPTTSLDHRQRLVRVVEEQHAAAGVDQALHLAGVLQRRGEQVLNSFGGQVAQ